MEQRGGGRRPAAAFVYAARMDRGLTQQHGCRHAGRVSGDRMRWSRPVSLTRAGYPEGEEPC